MNPITRVVLAGVAAILGGSGIATAGGQQQQTFHKPMAPIGPTSEAQCRALQQDWSMVCQRIRDTHQQCLDANKDPNIKNAGPCSKAPCLSLHYEMEACGGAEERHAVDSCYASVRAHQAREAEYKRAIETERRAREEAERARRAGLENERQLAEMAADRARQRRDAYKRNTPSRKDHPGFDGRQASLVADARNRADDAAARRLMPPPGPRPEPMPHDAIGNNTFPELDGPASFLKKIGKYIKLPGLEAAADIASWFTGIHDGRRAELERARAAFNDAFRQDRPDDRSFDMSQCQYTRDYCIRVFEQLSPDTRRKFDEFVSAEKRYISWTDIGNITRGYGWTPDEQRQFMERFGNSMGGRILKWGREQAPKNPTWDRKDQPDRTWVQDLFNADLRKRLDQHFKNRPPATPPPAPPVAPGPSPEMFGDYRWITEQWVKLNRPGRSEPDLLNELLRQMPSVPVSTPQGDPGGLQRR